MMFILDAITRAQSSRWVSRLFCVAWLALTVPGSGKLGPSTQNRGLQINSSGRGETHYKSYSFGFVHLQRVTTKWKKNCQRSLWRPKKRKERKGTETLRIKSREKTLVCLCARLWNEGCFLIFWVLIEIFLVAKHQPVWLVMSQW